MSTSSAKNFSTRVVSVLGAVYQHRILIYILTAILIAVSGIGVTKVYRNSSVDAFVPLDHPAAIARDRATNLFGLEDPLVIGLSAKDGRSVFTPQAISLLRDIQSAVVQVEGVKKHDLISILTESAMSSDNGDLVVDPIVPEVPTLSDNDAQIAWDRVNSMPMMMDLLASRSGDMVTILVPVEDPDHAVAIYEEILAKTDVLMPAQYQISIAGVAAMNARLAQMVNGDTRIMVPVCVLVVLAIVGFALRSFRGIVGPLVVVAGAAALGVGTLGWNNSEYYLITTALPVIIMAISVADSLHMSTIFIRARRDAADMSAVEARTKMVSETWLPITVTTLTTIAGFIGLSMGTTMIPIVEFGLYAAVGVFGAWAISLFVLPVILCDLDVQPRVGSSLMKTDHSFGIGRWVHGLSSWSLNNPVLMLACLFGFVAISGYFASAVEFDYERKRYFQADEHVRQSDQRLNEALSGLNFLDIVVNAPEGQSLMTPKALADIVELKQRALQLPYVNKVVGIDDYISLMHEVLADAEPGSLPTSDRAPRQYMFLYEASGDPEDFKEEIDYDYQNALIRAQLQTDEYSETKPVVDALTKIAAIWSAQTGLQAAVGGRVAVNDGWMTELANTHFISLGFAILFIFLTTLVCFRSLKDTALAMVPVFSGILMIYAVMTILNIDIAPATSMTAAIAAGLGVDFGVHLLSHIRAQQALGRSLEEAIGGQYLAVGRACFFSAFSLIAGLAVLSLSSAPPLHWFGLLVAAASIGSAFGALVIIPGVLALGQRFEMLQGVKISEEV